MNKAYKYEISLNKTEIITETVLKDITCTNVIGAPNMIPRIVEKLLERGLLKPLTDIQRKSAFSVLCMNAE